MEKLYELSGFIERIDNYDDGVSRVSIKSSDLGTRRAEIIFFGVLDRRYTGRVVDFKEALRPDGSLYQTLDGVDFNEQVAVSKEQIERFRNRKVFIPRIEVELEQSRFCN